MLLRPQDFLNMRDEQRKLIKAYLKDCHVVLLLAGIIIWCKRVRVVLLTDAYSSFFLCNGLPWRFEASFPSLCEVSEQWFHSCQPSHGTKYLLTNCHWNSLFQVLTRLKQALFFFCPSEGVITPEIFVCDNVSTKLTNLPFPCWRNIHRLDCLCCNGINAVKDSQMKPETPNASDTSPHSWSKMQIETF